MDRQRKKVKIFREENIDDNAILQMIMKKAESLGIELITEDINWIMQ